MKKWSCSLSLRSVCDLWPQTELESGPFLFVLWNGSLRCFICRLVCHGPVWSGLDQHVFRAWCLFFTIITSRASVWCNFNFVNSFLFLFLFLFGRFWSLPCSVFNLFPAWWFPCLYRLCVYLNTNIFLSCLQLEQDRQASWVIERWDLGGECVFQQKLLALVVKVFFFSCRFCFCFVFFKPLLCVSMSVSSVQAKVGVCKQTNQSLPWWHNHSCFCCCFEKALCALVHWFES